jgi:hypothetical protein
MFSVYLLINAQRMTSFFGSTYICEQFFSKMKAVKRKSRNRVVDGTLESRLRVATSHICPDKENLVEKKQW